MDQLDPRIPLMVQPPAPIDPLRIASQVQGMRIQQQQAAAQEEWRRSMAEQRQAQTANLQREAAESAALNDLFSSGQPVQPGALYKIVGPERGAKILKGLLDYQGAKIDSEDKFYKSALTRLDAIDAFPADLRPKMWDAVVQDYAGKGLLDPSRIPPYSPEAAQQIRQSMLSPDKRYDIQNPKPLDVGGRLVVPQPDGSVKVLLDKEPQKPASVQEFEYAVKHGYKGNFTQYQNEDANRKRPITNVNTGAAGSTEPLPPEPASQDILSQTGLSLNAFRTLTGQTSQLPRDAATRAKAAAEAQTWARKHGVDISALPSQYKAYNDTLTSNITRLNNTKIMEQELAGTVQNLQQVIGDDFSKVKIANVWKIWAGEQVNDDQAQQYAFHLGQLRNELAAYYAAASGRPGSGITITDLQEAERTIKNGVGQGGLKGIESAIHNSTAKMGPVMQASVDRSQQAIWTLFGVGQNYKAKTPGGGGTQPPPSATAGAPQQRPIPGIPGGIAELRNGKWIRIK